MDKVSFQEAAKQAGVHLNTVKNWRKAGKFKTAQKVLENGHELWLVDPAEVVQIARQARQNLPDIAEQSVVDLGENKVDNRSDAQTTQPNWPPTGQNAEELPSTQSAQGLAPALEQNLTFFRESIVRPLVEDLARARTELGEAKEEIGTLKERLRALEASQPLPQPTPAPEPSPVLSSETLRPEPPRKRRWWQF